MRRHLNFTGRARIYQRDARVALRLLDTQNGAQPLVYDLKLDLGPYREQLSDTASIRVQAARGNTVQRWDWGTVGALREPPERDRILTEVGVGARFSVFVTATDGSGRLLGLADRIVPEQPVRSLIAVEESNELGEEVWRVEFDDGDIPVLKLNASINGISEIVRTDVSFHSLVLPHVLRQVLYRAVVVDDAAADDDEPRWQGWLRLARFYLPDEEVPAVRGAAAAEQPDSEAIEEALGWIDRVVAAFTERNMQAASLYAAAVDQG